MVRVPEEKIVTILHDLFEEKIIKKLELSSKKWIFIH